MKVLPPAQSKESQVNVISYMVRNVPVIVLLAQTALNNEAFRELGEECTPGAKAGIIVSFTVLTLVGLLWTVIQSRADYMHNYPHAQRNWGLYAAIQSVVMVWSFYSLNYYTHEGVPFNCFFQYNKTGAQVMFWLSFVLIGTISYMEHNYWKKLEVNLPLSESFGN